MDHIKFLKQIGSKGGKRRLERADRVELARQAAIKRWHKNDTQPKNDTSKASK